MTKNTLIKELSKLKKQLLGCSIMLDDAGYKADAQELFGAAKILMTWIEGIQRGGD